MGDDFTKYMEVVERTAEFIAAGDSVPLSYTLDGWSPHYHPGCGRAEKAALVAYAVGLRVGCKVMVEVRPNGYYEFQREV